MMLKDFSSDAYIGTEQLPKHFNNVLDKLLLIHVSLNIYAVL